MQNYLKYDAGSIGLYIFGGLLIIIIISTCVYSVYSNYKSKTKETCNKIIS